ncbi:efflux transporter outer membrane subunit [Sphingomonas immobilis]|uniref:Efflux transporter outer membrane subunit n=1 Tax=Sphingomonas immobilis TaxID=3063997 RepID=A0ABT8ZZ26_9SPHN|nr:efflux transporter outer membrane subunit [Sphingomonas sp. CA1-15]MDO7842831.1 efflux transporter outer membrane subunit [Sphingomonas sp. CA1-15]
MSNSIKLSVLIAAIALAGCTVGPNFARPEAPASNGYAATGDAVRPIAGGPHATLGEGAGPRWWQAFGSAQLDALVDKAIANNNSLAASNATLERAREQIRAVAGKRLPQIDANARIEREQVNLQAFGFDSSAFPGISTKNPVFNLYSVGGGVSYDLDLFGRNRRKLEQAVAIAEAQQRQTEAAHLTIAGRVVEQVLIIATYRARIAVAEALLAEDQKLVDLTDKRRIAGEGTLTEVTNVQAQLAADRDDIPQLRQPIDEARHMLATLTGVAPDALGPTDFDIATFTLPADVPVAIPATLVRKRPDILQAEADLHASTAAIGVATAELYPNISIGATLTYAAGTPGGLFSNDLKGFDIFGGLTAPIFHGGTLKAQQRMAVDDAKAKAATYRQTILEAFQQVADLLSALQTDQRALVNHQDSVAIAGRSRNLSRRSFQVGNSGILTVLDSERLYQRAQLGLVDARAKQFLNVARLYVATAGGWTGPAVIAATP